MDSDINTKQIETIVKQVLGSAAAKEFTSEISKEIATQVCTSIIDILTEKIG